MGIGAALQGIEALERLGSRIPIFIRSFSDSQISSVSDALNVPPLQTPLLLPFAIALVMQRLAAPWQIIRIATDLPSVWRCMNCPTVPVACGWIFAAVSWPIPARI